MTKERNNGNNTLTELEKVRLHINTEEYKLFWCSCSKKCSYWCHVKWTNIQHWDLQAKIQKIQSQVFILFMINEIQISCDFPQMWCIKDFFCVLCKYISCCILFYLTMSYFVTWHHKAVNEIQVMETGEVIKCKFQVPMVNASKTRTGSDVDTTFSILLGTGNVVGGKWTHAVRNNGFVLHILLMEYYLISACGMWWYFQL